MIYSVPFTRRCFHFGSANMDNESKRIIPTTRVPIIGKEGVNPLLTSRCMRGEEPDSRMPVCPRKDDSGLTEVIAKRNSPS